MARLKPSDISPTLRPSANLTDTLARRGHRQRWSARSSAASALLLADAEGQGLAARNAVRDLRRNRRRGKERNAEKRQKGKLKVGVHIPAPDEIKGLITMPRAAGVRF